MVWKVGYRFDGAAKVDQEDAARRCRLRWTQSVDSMKRTDPSVVRM